MSATIHNLRDAQARLRGKGWQPPALIVETVKRPGDRIIVGHRCYRVDERGGWREEATPSPVAPAPVAPSPWTIIRSDLRGAALGLLVLASLVFLAWAAMVIA